MDHPKCRDCGERHKLGAQHCRMFKSSRGGVEGHARNSSKTSVRVYRRARDVSVAAQSEAAGIKPGPREATKRKPGGVRIEDRASTIEATKPWAPAGMSRRTWYRRQAEKRAGKT